MYRIFKRTMNYILQKSKSSKGIYNFVSHLYLSVRNICNIIRLAIYFIYLSIYFKAHKKLKLKTFSKVFNGKFFQFRFSSFFFHVIQVLRLVLVAQQTQTFGNSFLHSNRLRVWLSQCYSKFRVKRIIPY